jgi:hypothetical protein
MVNNASIIEQQLAAVHDAALAGGPHAVVCGVPGCRRRTGARGLGFARLCDYQAHCRLLHPAAAPVPQPWVQRPPGAGHAAAGAAAAAAAAAVRAEIAGAERPRAPYPQLQGAPPPPPPLPVGAAAPPAAPAAGQTDLQWADVGAMTHASCLPLVPYVHPLLRPLFVRGMVAVLAGMVASGDAGRQLGAWHAFFLMPRMLFWTAPDLAADPAASSHRDGDTRLNYGVLRYRLERFVAGDYGRLLEEAQAAEDTRRAALAAARAGGAATSGITESRQTYKVLG